MKKTPRQLQQEIEAVVAKPTKAQLDMLDDLHTHNEVWWHDLPGGARDVAFRKGWIYEVRNPGCGTRGHHHPGYVAISNAGLALLRANGIAAPGRAKR